MTQVRTHKKKLVQEMKEDKGYVSSGMETEYTEIFSQTKVNDKAKKSSAKESKSESIAKKFLKHEKIT